MPRGVAGDKRYCLGLGAMLIRVLGDVIRPKLPHERIGQRFFSLQIGDPDVIFNKTGRTDTTAGAGAGDATNLSPLSLVPQLKVVKKAQQRLYFLRILRKSNLEEKLLLAALKITGCTLPSRKDIFSSRCLGRAANILKDPSHPGHNLFHPSWFHLV
ncbi:hypothetical protein N1851_020115 [Merluccius polli]|uniref:Alkylated DNA repair protein AlkB homologue 8 N-terminal domain-containing protein n=1 Tax=Merluccius polli TaxID=89951 RepID=A0AA47MKW0_MERPO|nr:hypothetical protein N1851_020115 [Merluccius polli]